MSLTPAELLGLLGHFALLSLLAVGGAITTASDMHRYVVTEHGWLSDAQFTASVAAPNWLQARPSSVQHSALRGYLRVRARKRRVAFMIFFSVRA